MDSDDRARIAALELLVADLYRRLLLASGDPDVELSGTKSRIAQQNLRGLTRADPVDVEEAVVIVLDAAQTMTGR